MITRLQFHRSIPCSIVEKNDVFSIEVKVSGEFHEVSPSYAIANYTIGLVYHTWGRGGADRGSGSVDSGRGSADRGNGRGSGQGSGPRVTARHYFSVTTEVEEEVVGSCSSSGSSSSSNKEVHCLPVDEVQRSYKSNGQVLRVQCRSPSECGYYSLEVHATTTSATPSVEGGSSSCSKEVARVIILPVLSDVFEVVEGAGRGRGSGNILLANYRPITLPLPRSLPRSLPLPLPLPLPRVRLLAKECYGSVLGGHVYDSAVVLADYLLRHHYFSSEEVEGSGSSNSGSGGVGVMVELGAGCGLVSMTVLSLLALATPSSSSSSCHYHRVIITDRPAQLPLLEENLSINSSSFSSCCEVACQAFSWECREDFQALLAAVTTPSPAPPSQVVVLAADVLYDSEGARLFCEVVREMVEALETRGGVKVVVMVAQKDRQHTGPPGRTVVGGEEGEVVVYEEQMKGGLRWQCIEYDEVAEVIIWQLSSLLSSTTSTV